MEDPIQGEVTVSHGGRIYTGWYTVDDDLLTLRVPDREPVATHLGNFSPETLARMLLEEMIEALDEGEA